MVRLGKIKCAAKALDCVSACSTLNFSKFGFLFVNFLFVYCRSCQSFRVSANLYIYAVFLQNMLQYIY